MAIDINHTLDYPPAKVWEIIGDPGRADWVTGVTAIEFDGEVRRFKMDGAGDLAERIVTLDHEKMHIAYSVIESAAPLTSHLASMSLEPTPAGTRLRWRTDVQPQQVEPFIRQGMEG